MCLTLHVTGMLQMLTIHFGDGFDWETAPWYSVEGLQDVANLHDQVLSEGHQYTVESLQK